MANARSGDLVAILDDQDNQQARLRTKIAQLQAALTKLENSGSDDAAARAQAQQQADAIGILTGTLPATGPGLTLTITDPKSALRAADLLDVVEELRGAGAETIEFGAVRLGVSSSFVDGSDGIELDDTLLTRPFVVRAIGPAATMDTALNIPGGVAATARTAVERRRWCAATGRHHRDPDAAGDQMGHPRFALSAPRARPERRHPAMPPWAEGNVPLDVIRPVHSRPGARGSGAT